MYRYTIPSQNNATGHDIILETGRLAKQAHGSVLLTAGKTMILATVVVNKEQEENIGFLPLYVDYQEKFAAAGRIPGGFFKREGKANEQEILIARLVDRAIRPLFPKNFFYETQINISLISSEKQILPDTLAALAASTALAITEEIPSIDPISEVRVAKIKGQLCINPLKHHLKDATMHMIVGATEENILMVEGEMNEADETEVIEAIKYAHQTIKIHCQAQIAFQKELQIEKLAEETLVNTPVINSDLHQIFYNKIHTIITQNIQNKKERKKNFQKIKKELKKYCETPEKSNTSSVNTDETLHEIKKKVLRDLILQHNQRLDGRKNDEIRNIAIEVDILPSTHGSSLFTRGETQSLTTVTLGNQFDEQIIDGVTENTQSKFILHYNFPGFSTGEVKPNRGPSRREIGHGHLATRALKAILPIDNLYTIRIVSDILESNGSSSMATVCAASLAMMDAGIPIQSAVAGIAMGMVVDQETQKNVILSDILGDEDHIGDMDFKIAGTQKGITACQMDIKIAGIDYDTLTQALAQAKKGRLHILSKMDEVITKARDTHKPHAPTMYTMPIKAEVIRTLIGPSGKTIQSLQKETNTTITIQENDQKTFVHIYGFGQKNVDNAVKKIQLLIKVPVVGDHYLGIVKSILDFGAFIEFLPGKDGLLHISEVALERVEKIENFLTVGQKIEIKLIDIDKKGKYKLSRKALLSSEKK